MFLDSYSSTNPKFWTATLGEHRLKEKDAFEQKRQVEQMVLHPKYKSMFLEGILDTPPDYDVGKSHCKLASYTGISLFSLFGFLWDSCSRRVGV